jgi:hypothetical protein
VSHLYDIIRAARDNPNEPISPSADPDRLRQVLEELDSDSVMAFGIAFNAELARLNDWKLWDAGYVAAGGMGDDSFHYFRSWLIGKGERVVAQALTDPDGLVPFLDDRELDNELLEYVAVDVLERRGVVIDPRDSDSDFPDADPAGQHMGGDDKLDRRFPMLAAWRERGNESVG